MDVEKFLAGLREQRDRVEEAIQVLERLERTMGPRRGRPPNRLMGVQALQRGLPGRGDKDKPDLTPG